MSYLLSGGRVVDPASGTDELLDVLIEGPSIARMERGIAAGETTVIDAAGLVIAPGLVDMHTHVREPGREDEETIASASAAAAVGGYTGERPG